MIQDVVQGDKVNRYVSIGSVHLVECSPIQAPHEWRAVCTSDDASAAGVSKIKSWILGAILTYVEPYVRERLAEKRLALNIYSGWDSGGRSV